MKINYKHIQFLLGIDGKEAKQILIDSLLKMGVKSRDIMGNEYIEVSKICRKPVSYCDAFNGKNIVEITIKELKKHGVSDTLRRNILEDPACIMKQDLVGKYSLLKRILSLEQIDSIKLSLSRRRIEFIGSANKIPKNLKMYAEEKTESNTSQLRLLY